MNMRTHVFQPRSEPKHHKRAGIRSRQSKEEFHNEREILMLQNQIGLKLLRLLKEREKLKRLMIMEESGCASVDVAMSVPTIADCEMKVFTQLHMLQSRTYGSEQCTQNCFYDQFKHLPVTFLCAEVIEYMTWQQKEQRERGRPIGWPDSPAVVRDVHEGVLVVKPCNRMGVVMEDKRIVIGDECRTLFVRQIDEERTQICLVDGNRVRTNRVMMQFEHMKQHGVGYKQSEQHYIRLIQQEVEKQRHITVELEHDDSEFYIQI